MDRCAICDADGIHTRAEDVLLDAGGQRWKVCSGCATAHARAVKRNRPSRFDAFLQDRVKAVAVDGRAYHFCRA